ncbi:MAG: MMPL family transporter [Verrucomicrobiales bacterium]
MTAPSHRWRQWAWMVGGLLILAGYVAVGLSRISLDVDITRLLPPGLKETAGYRLFLKNFAGSDELMLTLEGGDAAAVEQVADVVARSLRTGRPPLARRVVWRSPFEPEAATDMAAMEMATSDPLARPDAEAPRLAAASPDLIELLAWALLNQPPEALTDAERRFAPDRLEATLAGHLESMATSLDASEHLFGYDPLGIASTVLGQGGNAHRFTPSLASPDGTFRLMVVESAWPLTDYKAMAEWLNAVRISAETVATPRGVTVRFTGEPAFVSEISQSMERDMKLSGGLALALICLIVWLGYRDLRLLPLLTAFVVVIFLLTVATAGLLTGHLTVLTVGCGSILIGLTVDYGVLMYASSGAAAAPEQQARTRRGIIWAAATTAASFGALTFAGLPGLAELGILVTTGVVIGAVLFLIVYPRTLRALGLGPKAVAEPPPRGTSPLGMNEIPRSWSDRVLPWLVAGAAAIGLAGLMVHGFPRFDLDSGSLRPRVSEAYDALDQLTEKLGGGEQSLSILVAGRDEAEVARRLADLEQRLQDMEEAGLIASYALPRPLWPDPEQQRANLLGSARRLAADQTRLREAVLGAGFAEDAFALTAGVFDCWRQWTADSSGRETGEALWPSGPAARWLLDRFAVSVAVGDDPQARSLCLGLVRPFTDPPDDRAMAALSALQTDGVYLAGSRLIGRVIEAHLARGFTWLAIAFGAVTLGLLAFALRQWRLFWLVAFGLTLSFATLIGCMAWLGLGWNSFTLPALLICLGTGSDYFIYVALELKEHGSIDRMRARLVRPLLVCVGASVCGFGSLAWAGNLGLSSLGRVCALALAINVVVALVLLPWIWRTACGRIRK